MCCVCVVYVLCMCCVCAVYQDPEDKSVSRHVTFVSRGCEDNECQGDAAPCNLIDMYQCLEEPAASIIRAEGWVKHGGR